MALDAIRQSVTQASEAWAGWDWAHDPGSCSCGEDKEQIVTNGPGAVDDWGAWEKERTDELVSQGHTSECAESAAASEREYGESAQDDADGAAEFGREALAYASLGDWPRAIRRIEAACSAESYYGDSPTWSPVLQAIKVAAHEASWDSATEMRGIGTREGVHVGERAVVVYDGADTWACTREDWDQAREEWDLVLDLSEVDAYIDAYQHLCDTVPCMSAIGTSDGDCEEITAALLADNYDDRDGIAARWSDAVFVADEDEDEDECVGADVVEVQS